MAYPNNFPGSLNDHGTNNNITDGATIVKAADIDNLNAALDDVEETVGVTGSAVTTSHDYIISRTVIQTVNVQDGAYATGTTAMPLDDTIPTNTEGDEYMTLAITPTSATNKLKIEVVWLGSSSEATSGTMVAALYQDATAAALAVGWGAKRAAANNLAQVVFTHWMTSGTVASTTFKVRAGMATGGGQSTYFNGTNGARIYGGVAASSITISEIRVP